MFRWNLMLRTLFGLQHEQPKARNPRPTVKLRLEKLEDRTVPSVSPENPFAVVSVGSPPPLPSVAAVTTYLASTFDQYIHLRATVQRDVLADYSELAQEIVQEVSYFEQQWARLLGINLNASNPLPTTPVQQTNSDSGSGITLQPDAIQPQTSSAAGPSSSTIARDFGHTPLSYVPNVGQTDSSVNYLAQGPGFSLFLTPTGAAFDVPTTIKTPASSSHPSTPVFDAFAMQLTGANPNPQIVAHDKLPGTSNYFLGNDPKQWHTDVPNYGAVEYDNIYSGINLVYDSVNTRQFEYHFVVNPGASTDAIQQTWQGVTAVCTDSQGDLILQTPGGPVVQQAPQAYQLDDAGNKHDVSVNQVISAADRPNASADQVATAAYQVSFRLGNYDLTRPLIIDPSLAYSTYLGGSGDDIGYGIAVNSSGDAYVAGVTTSTDFPTQGGLSLGTGTSNVFVTKFNSTGNALVYSSYFGGAGGGAGLNQGSAIAVDSSGNAYLTGFAAGYFPLQNAYQNTGPLGSGSTAFVTKINATGDALVYSTYLGPTATQGNAIAVDANGDAFVTGSTQGSDAIGDVFPTTAGAFQTTYGGGTYNGYGDAFITEFAPAGNTLVYSSFLGGSGDDSGNGVAVDSQGNAYIAGSTTGGFPTTVGAFQTTAPNSTKMGFVVKVNSMGSALLYSTYLGGNTSDQANAIAVDGSGDAFVTGWTQSSNFPTQGAFQSTLGGTQNAFVTELASSGASLVYSSYLGGRGTDSGNGIALDTSGDAFVVGTTSSTNFPTANPFQGTYGGGSNDAFVTKVNSTGNMLTYSSYLGGSGDDEGTAVAVDSSGNAYLTGFTNSTNFPTVNPFQGMFNNGAYDAFVTKVQPT